MVEWRKYFLISLGIHGVVLLLISCLGFQFSPPNKNNAGEMSVQFVSISEDGMQGGGRSENTASLTPVAGRSASPPQEAPAYENGKERLVKPDDDGLEPALAATNTNHSPPTGDSVSSSAEAGLNTGGQAKTANQALQSGAGSGVFSNGNFLSNGDGSYTALQAEGITYTIIRDADARYPEEARSIGYSRVVSVQAKILVGLDGFVESVEIVNSVPNLGFKESAIQALRKMQFAPIYYQSHNVKMYFTKKIYFQP
jgi:protein TonB